MLCSEHNKSNIFRKLSFMFRFSYLSPIKLESPLPAYAQTLHPRAASCPYQQTQKYHTQQQIWWILKVSSEPSGFRRQMLDLTHGAEEKKQDKG